MPANSKSAIDTWWSHVEKTDGCWIWTGELTGGGYGRFRCKGIQQVAHRWGYEALRGPVGFGLDLDHLCRVRACVNPDHLEPVTRRENLLRGCGLTAVNAGKSHCLRGHEYTFENTLWHKNGRECRTCRFLRNRNLLS